MVPLPTPFRRSGQQMAYDGDDKAFFDCYTNQQMLAYGEACRQEALKDAAAKDHPDEHPIKVGDSKFEGWYSQQHLNLAEKGIKQIAREAYEAGLNEPAQPAAWVVKSELLDLQGCNGRSIWAESPNLWYDEQPYDHLVPLYLRP